MQYSDRITAKLPTSYNEYSEPVFVDEVSLRCRIIDDRRSVVTGAEASYPGYDMKIIVPAKIYDPYVGIFTQKLTLFVADGREYAPISISKVRNFSSKPVHYEIELRQV